MRPAASPPVRLGAHTSIAGGLHRALERGAELGCDVVQVFTGSSRSWAQRPIGDAERSLWEAARRRTGVEPVMAHAPYLINLAAKGAAQWRHAIGALAGELDRCRTLSIPYLVLHPGSHKGAGEAAGVARVARAIDAVHQERPDDPTVLLLETTAGQGSSVGHSFEQLRDILALVAAPARVAVCLDTQHLHAAGLDIAGPAGWAATLDAFDRVVGLDRVRALHVNDSKRPQGARVDRHEHIGRGHLGLEAFRALLAEPRLRGLPMAIETPRGEDGQGDRTNLGVLRALAAGTPRRASVNRRLRPPMPGAAARARP